MSKLWAWLKKWGLAIAGGLAALATLGWYVHRQRNALGEIKDKLVIAEATKEIERLRATRKVIEEDLDETDDALLAIDRQIITQRQRVLDAHEVDPELSDEQVAERLRQVLGE